MIKRIAENSLFFTCLRVFCDKCGAVVCKNYQAKDSASMVVNNRYMIHNRNMSKMMYVFLCDNCFQEFRKFHPRKPGLLYDPEFHKKMREFVLGVQWSDD